MTKVDALKDLYVKLGGNASDVASVDNIADMIDKVKNIAENGGELPDGGSNGQVLTKKTGGVEWKDVPSELPSGGTAGNVLKKTATGTEWGDEAGGGKIYRHDIHYTALGTDDISVFEDKTITWDLTLYTSSSTQFTTSTFETYAYGKYFPCVASVNGSNSSYFIGFSLAGFSPLSAKGIYKTGGSIYIDSVWGQEYVTFTDTVTEV